MEDLILRELALLETSIDSTEGTDEDDREAMKLFASELKEDFFSVLTRNGEETPN